MLTDDWYPALTRPNVELVTDRIAEVTPTGIRTQDGTDRLADVLVLATGFATTASSRRWTSRAPAAPRSRRRGRAPRAYLGMSVPGFPNMFLLYGPNTNGGSGSVIYTIEAGVAHVIAALDEPARGRAPHRGAGPDGAGFDRELREALRETVWHGLHELVRRRAGQRPQPVAVAVEHVPPAHGAARAGRLRAGV